ncbi:MAG TPA: DNA alkylation repair protein [Dehalococcoidia bacterium]|nr:DNA alkylation repair protein [Dehalococcoidia bacterium]
MTADEIIADLRAMANPRRAAGMARFGITSTNTLGISVPALRALAKRAGRDHAVALALWESGIHEARILAAMLDQPAKVTKRQMDRWAADFDSWDVVDGCCGDLFDRTPYAYEKALQWSADRREYVKRAGFVLMATLAVHDKAAPDSKFRQFLPLIVRESSDERNFVKKSVNWALRQIGKRNLRLNAAAIATAERILATDTRAGRWIARDALRELRSGPVQARLRR